MRRQFSILFKNYKLEFNEIFSEWLQKLYSHIVRFSKYSLKQRSLPNLLKLKPFQISCKV